MHVLFNRQKLEKTFLSLQLARVGPFHQKVFMPMSRLIGAGWARGSMVRSQVSHLSVP